VRTSERIGVSLRLFRTFRTLMMVVTLHDPTLICPEIGVTGSLRLALLFTDGAVLPLPRGLQTT
jgi:hypothetical protein